MIVSESRMLKLKCLQAWWPESADSVRPLLSEAPLVRVVQCSDAVRNDLRGLTFRRKEFHTLMLDLRLGEEELWSRLRPKSCRYKISKARQLSPEVVVNEELDTAFELIRTFIGRKGFRTALSRREWESWLQHSDVFVVKHEGRAASAHVVLRDPPYRARFLAGGTMDRSERVTDRVVGQLNRYLFWTEILHYMKAGVGHYDFGGITLTEDSPSVSQFKRSFGGDVATDHILLLAENPLLRGALRGVMGVRSALRDDESALGPETA